MRHKYRKVRAKRPFGRKPKTKRDAFRHASRRAAQRYGIHLTPADYEELLAQVRSGASQHLGRQSATRSIHMVELRGQPMKVVYQNTIGAILTVLAPDMVTRAERLAEKGLS